MTTLKEVFSTKPPFTVHHLFVVDASYRTVHELSRLTSQVNDSLDSIRQATKRHTAQTHQLTMMIIQNGQIKCLHHDRSIDDVQPLDIKKGHGRKTTLILDAIGSCIATWRALGQRRQKSDKHQVSIFSPVHDRGSQKYNICNLKMIINSLIRLDWNFTLIGESPLIPHIASNLCINNYYICKSQSTGRDRNFLISQLRRQWRHQQVSNVHPETTTQVAA